MTAIEIRDVCKSYGAVQVMSNVSMEIAQGEFIVFVGPSGCGKSTLLRMIAGLEEITDGEISINNRVVNDEPASKRGVAMVFQSYALYPHMTVEENMTFSLKLAGTRKAERMERVRNAASMLQLEPYLKRRPKELSGGQRQRVAIGRAIVRDAGIFLFDEPLSNLDAALRVSTRVEIAKLKHRLSDTTMIYVTHDQTEAMTLADRIVVLNKGTVEQIGTPEELYNHPRNKFIAGFIGSPAMNMLPCTFTVRGDAVVAQTGDDTTCDAVFKQTDTTADLTSGTLGVRPEDLQVCNSDEALISGKVDVVEYLGDISLVHLMMEDGSTVQIKMIGPRRVADGSTIHLSAPPARIYAFDANGNALTNLMNGSDNDR
jgi:alpha-glucoside transport system ATP-binding protein